MRSLFIEETDSSLTGDVIYPICVFLSADECRISVRSNMRRAAETFAADLSEAESPGERLLALFSPVMREAGFAPLPKAEEAVAVWRGISAVQPAEMPVYRLADLPELPWVLTHGRAEMSDSAFVASVDGKVVSAAWYTDAGIAVETAPGFRRRGLARVLVAHLTADRCARGEEVVYRCRASNAASMALAESLGFTMIAREYRPGFRRDRRSG